MTAQRIGEGTASPAAAADGGGGNAPGPGWVSMSLRDPSWYPAATWLVEGRKVMAVQAESWVWSSRNGSTCVLAIKGVIVGRGICGDEGNVDKETQYSNAWLTSNRSMNEALLLTGLMSRLPMCGAPKKDRGVHLKAY
jgi:hypothetical protein